MAIITPTTTPTSTLILYATDPGGALKTALTDPPGSPGEAPTLPDDATVAAALTSVLAELDRRIPIP